MPIIQSAVYDEKLTVLGCTTEAQRAHIHQIFTGPSVDLHRWAMDTREQVRPGSGLTERQSFFKAIYAVLPSWGMHRMGQTETKMPPFVDFAASLEIAWPSVAQLWNAGPPIDEGGWLALQNAFHSIKARAGHDEKATQIVSRSKVLAHLLPNICAPIDRRYTLTFFGIDTCHQDRVKRQPDYEWRLFREMHEQFFHRFPTHPSCQAAAAWRGGSGKSLLKIADDLIVVNTPKRQQKRRGG